MKANRTEFKTKTAAREYITSKGWVFYGKSIGDDVFKNPALPNQTRMIHQLNNRRWYITA